MAISALAGSKLVAASAPHGPLHWATPAHDVLRTVTLVTLGLALAWYAVLVGCELLSPRLPYDVRRWATVFPLGMTAVASLSVSTAADIPALWTCGKLLLWPALAVWAVVATGAVRAARRGIGAVRVPSGSPRVNAAVRTRQSREPRSAGVPSRTRAVRVAGSSSSLPRDGGGVAS